MDFRLRTGVTQTVSYFAMTLSEGVARRAQLVVRGSRTLVDGLIEVMG